MSLFARILSRAAVPGQPALPLARPKGRLGGLSRLAEPEPDEEDLSPLYRAAMADKEEEEIQTLRRAAAEEEEEPAQRAPADEEEEDPARAARRLPRPASAEEEDEEPAQAIRRADPPEEEEPARTLRRAVSPAEEEDEPVARSLPPREEDEDKALPLRPLLRRAPPKPGEPEEEPLARLAPDADQLDPRTGPRPAWLSAEPEPDPLLTLRRAEAAGPTATGTGWPAAAGEIAAAAPPVWPGEDGPMIGPAIGPGPMAAERAERPRVVIDRIDVTIHEPAGGSGGTDLASGLARAMRSRYLGGM